MSKEQSRKVGNLIRKLRMSKGMSQMELANKLDINYQQVQRYEKGKSELTVTRLKQMVNALEVPVVMFLEQGFDVSDKSEKFVNNFLNDDEIRFLHLFRDITNMRLQKRIINILAQFIKMTEKL